MTTAVRIYEYPNGKLAYATGNVTVTVGKQKPIRSWEIVLDAEEYEKVRTRPVLMQFDKKMKKFTEKERGKK